EAIEGALKTARKHTRRRRIVAFEGGFHGDTLGALSIGGNPVYRAPFEPPLPEVTHLPLDDLASLAAIDAPPAAVVVQPVAVMATLGHDPPLAHVTTFGGHPLSCAAGLAALEVLLREDLPARAAGLGGRLLERLRALVGRSGLVVARGLGLLIGLEFAEPAA